MKSLKTILNPAELDLQCMPDDGRTRYRPDYVLTFGQPRRKHGAHRKSVHHPRSMTESSHVVTLLHRPTNTIAIGLIPAGYYSRAEVLRLSKSVGEKLLPILIDKLSKANKGRSK